MLRGFAERILLYEERRKIDAIAAVAARMMSPHQNGTIGGWGSPPEPPLDWEERKKIDEIAALDRGIQILLSIKYKELLRNNSPLPGLAETQFRSYSQNGEDGILLYIFSPSNRNPTHR